MRTRRNDENRALQKGYRRKVARGGGGAAEMRENTKWCTCCRRPLLSISKFIFYDDCSFSTFPTRRRARRALILIHKSRFPYDINDFFRLYFTILAKKAKNLKFRKKWFPAEIFEFRLKFRVVKLRLPAAVCDKIRWRWQWRRQRCRNGTLITLMGEPNVNYNSKSKKCDALRKISKIAI